MELESLHLLQKKKDEKMNIFTVLIDGFFQVLSEQLDNINSYDDPR